MKIAAHITFFYVEKRLNYLKIVVDGLVKMNRNIDVFIYTNQSIPIFDEYEHVTNMTFNYKASKVSRFHFNSFINKKLGIKQLVHPYFLTWEHRKVAHMAQEGQVFRIEMSDECFLLYFILCNLHFGPSAPK